MSTDTETNENIGIWRKIDNKYGEMTAGPNGYIYKILFWGTIIGLIIFVIIFLFVAPIRNFAVAAGLFGADMTSKYMFQDSQDANFLTILSIILGGILVAAITLGVVIGGGFFAGAIFMH
jgi:hypothetical protein